MLDLDGSTGGGWLVRTALALSSLTGEAIHMAGIREHRPNPGLRPQHLAAVGAVASVTDAEVDGADAGSRTLRFRPGPVRPGRHEVAVGTAGSLPLVFDALLPLAGGLSGVLAVRATGGTDVRWAPTADAYRRVKLPLLRRHGVAAALDLDRRGFHPTGGGDATLTLGPSTPARIVLPGPDGPPTARVYSVATTDLAGPAVAERQAATAAEALTDAGVEVRGRVVEHAEASSTGSAIAVRLDRGAATAGFDALGERGTPAETVAETAAAAARAWLGTDAAVDRHLADQLLVHLAVAGGRVAIPAVTEHVETGLELLERFGYDVRIERADGRPVAVASGTRD